MLVKFDSLGDWLKGGKGGKAVNGGKSSAPKEPARHELKIDPGLHHLK